MENDKESSNKLSIIEKADSNIQYDLFAEFYADDNSKFSNAIESWESIPKYFFTRYLVENLRNEDGLSGSYKWDYYHNNISYNVRIQPALIEDEDGKEQACFPGATEELVEEALKKIFSDQHGAHNPKDHESWVFFTLRMIHKELKTRNKSRNITAIKRAIDVMSKCTITLFKEGKQVWNGNILQDLTTVNRQAYNDDSKAQHAARLPIFISYSVDTLQYRQYNHDRVMRCSESLARWLCKLLVHRFRNANHINDFNILFSTIKRDSALLQIGEEKDQRKKVISALDELVNLKAISKYETENKLANDGTTRIDDVKYTIFPSRNFISEQKAANKRIADAKTHPAIRLAIDKANK
jgi:hypothetical protein